MGNTVDKVIKIAMEEVGYLEKQSGDLNYLYDKTANAGDKNYTKYGYEMHQIYPQVMDYPAPWCDCWCDWCFYKAYGVATAKSLLGGNFDDYTVASCTMYQKVNALGIVPTIGSQVFFTKNGQPSGCHHTGLVYDVDDTCFYTVEGNTSSKEGVIRNGGGVFKKKYKIDDYKGRTLFGYPAYDTQQPNQGEKGKIVSMVPRLKSEKPMELVYPCRGIDVSSYQKNMDYKALKRSGVQFAILKVIRKDLNKDTMFEEHYKGFTEVGIPIIGVYNYSYANTVERAKEEANAVIKALEGRKLPVYFDVEDKCFWGMGGGIADVINAYADIIRKENLPFGIYTGMNFYKGWIKAHRKAINCNNWWIARYYKKNVPLNLNDDVDEAYNPVRNSIMGGQDIIGWQYSSSCRVDGYDGRLDVNVMYKPIANEGKVRHFDNTRNVCTAPNKLHIRNLPSITGTSVGLVSRGDTVKVYEVKDGFYRIGKDQWCSGKYIRGELIGYVKRKTSLRNSETAKGKVIGTALVGDRLELLARAHISGWYLTPRGWIADKFIEIWQD